MNLGSTRRFLALTGCAVALGVLPACDEADPIPSTTGSLAVSVQASTAGTGRYETASFAVDNIVVRAVDPLGEAVFGSIPVRLTVTRVPGNLAPGASIFTIPSALPPGRYHVETLLIGPPQFLDATSPLPPSAVCIEKLAAVPASTGAAVPPINFSGFQLTDPQWTFDVGSGAQQLVVLVDAPAYVDLVESSFTCDESSGTPALTSFDSVAYMNGLLPLLGLRK